MYREQCHFTFRLICLWLSGIPDLSAVYCFNPHMLFREMVWLTEREVWDSLITLLQGPLCLFWAGSSGLHF